MIKTVSLKPFHRLRAIFMAGVLLSMAGAAYALPPTASDGSVFTSEDDAGVVLLDATDFDGPESLTFTIVTQPLNGTVTLFGFGNQIARYVPNPNFNGTDTFTFRAFDGLEESNVATITATVNPENDNPSADAGPSQSVAENTGVTLDGSGSTDVDGDSLNYVWSQTSGSAVTLDNPNAVSPSFTAPEVSGGGESLVFQLTVNDGNGGSDSASVTITVNNQNQAPVASNRSVNATEDVASPINMTDFAIDRDGNALTYAIVTGPTNGVLTGSSPNFVYTSSPNYSGPDSFIFLARDNGSPTGTSNVATVGVTVLPANDAPVANAGPDQTVVEQAGVQLRGDGSTDIDGNTLTYAWVQTGGPVVSISSPSAQNTSFVAPLVADNTVFTFQVTVTDRRGGVGTDSVSYVVRNGPASQLPQNPVISDLVIFPSPFSSANGGATIRYQLRESSDVTVMIVDLFGHTVREFTSSSGAIGGVAGNNQFQWDGKNGEGNKIGNGAYIVQVRANGSSGAKGKMNERVGVSN